MQQLNAFRKLYADAKDSEHLEDNFRPTVPMNNRYVSFRSPNGERLRVPTP